MESVEKFRKLGLTENLLKAIKDQNFTEPTEIQLKTIPLIVQGRDVLGSSATGSGKTLAFGSGIIDKIKKSEGVQALILTPTRELAEQITHALRRFSSYDELSVQDIYGGVSIEPQIRGLRHSDIVIGTPGRILDHIERRTIDLSKVRFLVLDEADRMLEMGFIDDVNKIISHCPKERQTLMFSATISIDIEVLSKKYMKNPVFVSVEQYVDPSKLAQSFYDIPSNQKFSLLVHLLKQENPGLVMVFCNTRRNVDLLAKNLKRYKIDALATHGGLAQNKRNSIMKSFNSNNVEVLICTDVAARGLDIKGVSHVYNYDVPKDAKDYIHRIGRTARAGKEGKAISLVSQRDYSSFRKICEDISAKIAMETIPKLESLNVNFSLDDRDDRRGFNRGRRFGRDNDHRHQSSRFGNRPNFRRRDDGDDRNRGNRGFRPRVGNNNFRSREGGNRNFRSREGGSRNFSSRERSGGSYRSRERVFRR